MEETYRIWMEEVGDLEEGWCNGHSEISNSPCYRTEDKKDADRYDVVNAVLIAADYRLYGYPCKVFPNVPSKLELAILSNR